MTRPGPDVTSLTATILRTGVVALAVLALGAVIWNAGFSGRSSTAPDPVRPSVQAVAPPPVPSADPSPAPIVVPVEYADLIRQAAERCPHVPVDVLAAQLHVESDFRPRVVSPAGAKGIAQFMPATWKAYGIDGNGDGKRRALDPQDAIPSAAEYNCQVLTYIRDVPGDDRVTLMLAAYNAGPGAVREYQGVPPFPETEAYVDRVQQARERLVWP